MEKDLKVDLSDKISDWVEKTRSDLYSTEFNKKNGCLEVKIEINPDDLVDHIEELIDSAIKKAESEAYDSGFSAGESSLE